MEEKRFENGGVLRWFGEEFMKRVEEEYVKKMLLRATTEVERIVQQLIKQPKHGRVYKIGKGSKTTYTASKAGEAPAVRSGRMRQSIRHAISKVGPITWEAAIGPTVKVYPGVLEDPEGLNRPVWQPALRQLGKKMGSIITVDRLS